MALAVTGIVQRSLSTGVDLRHVEAAPGRASLRTVRQQEPLCGLDADGHSARPRLPRRDRQPGRRATVRPTVRDWVIWLSSREANQVVQAAFAVIVMGLALVLTPVAVRHAQPRRRADSLRLRRRPASSTERSAARPSSAALTFSSIIIVVWAGTETIAARFAVGRHRGVSAAGFRSGGVASDILQDFWLTGSGLNTYGVATLFYPAIVTGHSPREKRTMTTSSLRSRVDFCWGFRYSLRS